MESVEVVEIRCNRMKSDETESYVMERMRSDEVRWSEMKCQGSGPVPSKAWERPELRLGPQRSLEAFPEDSQQNRHL